MSYTVYSEGLAYGYNLQEGNKGFLQGGEVATGKVCYQRDTRSSFFPVSAVIHVPMLVEICREQCEHCHPINCTAPPLETVSTTGKG